MQRPLEFGPRRRKTADEMVRAFDSNKFNKVSSRGDPGIPAAAARRAHEPPYPARHSQLHPVHQADSDRPRPARYDVPAGEYPDGMVTYDARSDPSNRRGGNTSSMAITPADRKRDMVLNEPNIIHIADGISRKIGRTLTVGEMMEIETVIKGQNFSLLSDVRISDINSKVASAVYRNIKNFKCRNVEYDNATRWRLAVKSQLDFQETQRRINNITNITNLSQSCCDEFYMSAPLIFDSRFADISVIPTRVFPFSVTNSSGSSLGKVATPVPITNVRKMSAGDFDIPYVRNLDNSETDQVGVLLERFKGQSYITPEGYQYHFLFNKEVIGNRMRLRAVEDMRVFTFGQAITSFTDVDITFLDGLRPISLPRSVEVTGAFASIPGPPIVFQITAANPHGMSSGDIAYFTEFQSAAAVTSPDESLLNDIRGHRITKVSDTIFTVNVDMSTNPLTFINGWKIYYGNQRWRMPLKVTFIRPAIYAAIAAGDEA